MEWSDIITFFSFARKKVKLKEFQHFLRRKKKKTLTLEDTFSFSTFVWINIITFQFLLDTSQEKFWIGFNINKLVWAYPYGYAPFEIHFLRRYFAGSPRNKWFFFLHDRNSNFQFFGPNDFHDIYLMVDGTCGQKCKDGGDYMGT